MTDNQQIKNAFVEFLEQVNAAWWRREGGSEGGVGDARGAPAREATADCGP